MMTTRVHRPSFSRLPILAGTDSCTCTLGGANDDRARLQGEF